MAHSILRFLILLTCLLASESLLLSKLGDSGKLKLLLANTMLKGKELQCLYTASKDGFTASSFHKKCDKGVPSLVIGQLAAGLFSSAEGAIIGGYSPFGYESVNDYRSTNKAFVFRYDIASKELFVCNKIGGSENAVTDNEDLGPIFGSEALRIPLNEQVCGNGKLKSITSILGNDYVTLSGGTGGSGGISGRRSGVAKGGNSLLGDSTTGTLNELEVYVAR